MGSFLIIFYLALITIVIFVYLCFNWINRIFNFNYRRFLMHFVQAKGLLSKDNGINIYRGCSHGCIYCDSRSRCYGFTHAFEDIEVKENAPELLEKALRSKRQKCMKCYFVFVFCYIGGSFSLLLKVHVRYGFLC